MTPTTPDDRWVVFEGAFNVRDLGGLSTRDGRVLRRGAVYRADSPQRLTPADRRAVAELDLGHVVDLRTETEAEFGCWAVTDVTRVHHFRVIDTLPDLTRPDPSLPRFTTVESMAERYVMRVETGTATFAAAVDTVAVGAQERVLFHCAAGKDRTGIVAAALLELLDVPRDVIVADYALSAAGMTRKIEHQQQFPLPNDTRYDLLPPLSITAKAEVMDHFLAILDERHGGLAQLLRAHGLRAEAVEALRRCLLDEG